MEYIHNLIWLCPLLFIAGFIDSIAGGGGLIALPAYMMCGMPIYYVYGCNKFQCAFGSTVAAWKYFKNGCLDLKITLISASDLVPLLHARNQNHLLPQRGTDPLDVNGTASTHRGPRDLYEERLELYRYEKAADPCRMCSAPFSSE